MRELVPDWRLARNGVGALELAASPVAWIALTLVVVLALQVADRVRSEPAVSSGAEPFYLAGQSEYVPVGRGSRETVSWSFADGLPSSWVATGRVLVPRAGNVVKVRTGTQPSAYQLISPPVTLEAGFHRAVVRGTVDRGGLSLGILDPKRETFLGTANFWSGQHRPAGTAPGVAFELGSRTVVRVVLSNWAPRPGTSNWTIGQVAIGPFAGDAEVPLARIPPAQYQPFYEASMSEFVREDTGPTLAAWDFTLQLPAGWRPVPGLRFGSQERALRVLTTQTAHGYQLVAPPVELSRGRYAVLLEATILRGGMMIGALDASTDQWLATRLFWHAQIADPGERIGVTFELKRPGEIRIVLANWAPEPNASSWALQRARVVRR